MGLRLQGKIAEWSEWYYENWGVGLLTAGITVEKGKSDRCGRH